MIWDFYAKDSSESILELPKPPGLLQERLSLALFNKIIGKVEKIVNCYPKIRGG